MFSPMMSTSWCLSNSIIVNSTPVFFTSSTFMCGFWISFQGSQETARFYFFPSILFSKYLNAPARLMYHKKSFVYGLTRPSLGQCDPKLRLKLFLKKVSLSQPSFRVFESKKKKKAVVIARRRW